MDIKQIKSDINGNPRFVFHFLSISDNYKEAVKLSHKIGGKRYHNKNFGGGIVVQAYSKDEVLTLIEQVKENK